MEKKHVLVVDDGPDLRRLLINFLESFLPEDYEIHQAADGIEGILQIGKLHPVLVLSDIQMSRMDGLELLRVIKEQAFPLKVIIMSGEEYQKSAVLEAGADAFLEKPFNNQDLMEEVKRLLGLS